MARAYDWKTLDPLVDQDIAQGMTLQDIATKYGIKRPALSMYLRSRKAQGTPTAHQGTPDTRQVTEEEHHRTPERTELSPDEQYTQEHHGTLEEYREVIEEVYQSVPDAPILAPMRYTSAHP
jgi:predicted transcriptional regulator